MTISLPQLRDRWLFWPAVTVLIGMFWLLFFCGLPGTLSFILIPLVVLGYPITIVALVVLVVVLAANKRFRNAVSVASAVLLPVLFVKPIGWVADCLHLGLTAGFGVGQLGLTSTQEDRQFATFDWYVGLAGGPSTFLIHDITDEIALPIEQHKFPRASENGFGEDCAGRVRHLLGHYYVCTF